jgi:hypothetical protein
LQQQLTSNPELCQCAFTFRPATVSMSVLGPKRRPAMAALMSAIG